MKKFSLIDHPIGEKRVNLTRESLLFLFLPIQVEQNLLDTHIDSSSLQFVSNTLYGCKSSWFTEQHHHWSLPLEIVCSWNRIIIIMSEECACSMNSSLFFGIFFFWMNMMLMITCCAKRFNIFFFHVNPSSKFQKILPFSPSMYQSISQSKLNVR